MGGRAVKSSRRQPAVLVLANLADEEGVFSYAGAVAARVSRGSPRRLLAVVFVIASVVTATLNLDATVVLLTPVVLATATRVGLVPGRTCMRVPTWQTRRRCCCRYRT